ncbi:Bro-N domain-containing protein [Tepidibacter hydrothermalis]|uniref:Bro-N domain-containing protein n=1 Tax=Tepidibacter hydrothermalis TaxID=3036126 RepID=A0ABY8EH26_9FIRM|nr:Bro-N domain-containing protein [Tepidibacter hydrothermalis]WFD12246.1 Bro-N domain-containing protein [Tepidibacter hydrothermalis]
MNQLQVFQNNEFGQVRTLNIKNEPWFVGKDVANALGYERTADAIRTHIDEDDKGVGKIQTPGGIQEMVIINESGLYSLILSSKLPSAKKFKKWVTSEVLPSIRKNGYYSVPSYQPKATSIGEVVNLIKMTRQSMKDQGCDPREIAIAVKQICEQFNINLPDCFIKPQETTLQDVFDMVDFIFSVPRGRGHKKVTYEDYIVQASIKRLKG